VLASVLIADEPTRGVDVGSKRAIYDLLTEMAASGMGVVVISSDLEEVLGLAIESSSCATVASSPNSLANE